MSLLSERRRRRSFSPCPTRRIGGTPSAIDWSRCCCLSNTTSLCENTSVSLTTRQSKTTTRTQETKKSKLTVLLLSLKIKGDDRDDGVSLFWFGSVLSCSQLVRWVLGRSYSLACSLALFPSFSRSSSGQCLRLINWLACEHPSSEPGIQDEQTACLIRILRGGPIVSPARVGLVMPLSSPTKARIRPAWGLGTTCAHCSVDGRSEESSPWTTTTLPTNPATLRRNYRTQVAPPFRNSLVLDKNRSTRGKQRSRVKPCSDPCCCYLCVLVRRKGLGWF